MPPLLSARLAQSPVPGPSGLQAGINQPELTARAFLFVLADEVLPSGKVVRKVMVAPDHLATATLVRNPEIFGFSPRAPGAAVSIGEHALGNNVSPYLSASTKPGGAPNFSGEPFYIDIAKAKAAGVRLYTEGHVPPKAVKSTTSMALTRGLRVVQVIGIVVSVYDLAKAGQQSLETHSSAPIAREGIRQVGGWGGALLGLKIGGTVGAAVGTETGPGAILTGAVGAMIFGTAGYLGADWVANWAVK